MKTSQVLINIGIGVSMVLIGCYVVSQLRHQNKAGETSKVPSVVSAEDPKEKALSITKFLAENRPGDVYACLSNDDKSSVSYELFIKELWWGNSPERARLLSLTKQSCQSIKVSDDWATVTLSINQPDYTLVTDEEKKQFLADLKSTATLRTINLTHDMVLHKEDNVWKLFWGAKDQLTYRRTIKEANELFNRLEFKGASTLVLLENREKMLKARALWEKLYKASPQDSYVRDNLEEIDQLSGRIEEFLQYRDKVKVSGVHLSKSSHDDEVCGEIKNVGDRAISGIQLTIYFLDKNKKRISEVTHYPLCATKGGDEPMKPNYGKPFVCPILNDIPSDWTREVEVVVSNIRFSK